MPCTGCQNLRFAAVLSPVMAGVTPHEPSLDVYTALPYILVMLFIETSTFTKLLPNYLTDEEYRGLQTYLLQKPDAGDLIKAQVGFARFDGHQRVRERAVVSEPFITGRNLTMRYGCSRCTVNQSAPVFLAICSSR